MKKFVFILFPAIVLLSCSKIAPKDVGEDSVLMIEFSSKITMADLPSILRPSSLTKGTSPCVIEPIVQGKDTVLFLVNYDDGWELLSADRRVGTVLASSEHGSMTANELFNANQAVHSYFENLQLNLQEMAKQPVMMRSYPGGNFPMSFIDENGTVWR